MITPMRVQYGDQVVDFSMHLDSGCPTDFAIKHYLDQNTPCEPEVVSVMLRALKEGDVVVDGGANVGYFTLLMSKLVGETGKVFAFEPDRKNFKKLLANLLLNDCKNVIAIDKALWSVLERLPFFSFKDGGYSSAFDASEIELGKAEKSEVEGVVLDYITLNDKVRLMKLDVEGSEVEALRGARRQLRDGMLLIVEMNPAALERAGTSVKALREVLSTKDCFMLSSSGHFPVYIPPDIEMVISRPNTNMLFCEIRQVKELWPEAHLWY